MAELRDLYGTLTPGPKTLEPSVRAMAPMPSSTGSGLDEQAGSSSVMPVGGEFNPLYLLALGGSILARNPGEPPGVAQAMLPFYMREQAAGQERLRKQGLAEAEASEYGKIQSALASSIDMANGDYATAAKLYGEQYQQLGLKNPDAAAKGLAVLGSLKDKALGQQIEAKDSKAAQEVAQMEQDGSLRIGSGMQWAQAFMLRGGSRAAAIKGADDYQKSIQTTNQGNMASRVNWNRQNPTAEYVGSNYEQPGPDRPGAMVSMGPGGPQSQVIPGMPYQRTEGGQTMMVNAEGTGAAEFAPRPEQTPIEQPPNTRMGMSVDANGRPRTTYTPMSDAAIAAKDFIAKNNPTLDPEGPEFAKMYYDAYKQMTTVPENAQMYLPSQRFQQGPQAQAAPTGQTAQAPTPGVGTEPVFRGNSAPVGGDVARLVGGINVAGEAMERLMVGSKNPEVLKYQGPAASWLPKIQEWTPEVLQGVTGKFTKEMYQRQKDLSSVENYLLNLRSGTAVTENELTRMRKELPQAHDTVENYQLGIANTARNIQQLKNIVNQLVLRKDKQALVSSGLMDAATADQAIAAAGNTSSGFNNPAYPDTSGGTYTKNPQARVPPKVRDFMFKGKPMRGYRVKGPNGELGYIPEGEAIPQGLEVVND